MAEDSRRVSPDTLDMRVYSTLYVTSRLMLDWHQATHHGRGLRDEEAKGCEFCDKFIHNRDLAWDVLIAGMAEIDSILTMCELLTGWGEGLWMESGYGARLVDGNVPVSR